MLNYEITQKPDKDGILYGEIVHKYNNREIFTLENTGELNQEVFNLELAKSEDLGFDWDYDEVPTAEEIKEKKEENNSTGTYVNYDELFSSEEEDNVVDVDDI